MKLNDFESDPHHAVELPVDYEADAMASTSPAAIPTVAPDALLCASGAELLGHWSRGPLPTYAAVECWHAFRQRLQARQPQPQRN